MATPSTYLTPAGDSAKMHTILLLPRDLPAP